MNDPNQTTVQQVPALGVDLEQGCIDLIAKMEASVSAARESTTGTHLEESAENGDKLLNSLLDFSEEFLQESEAEEVKAAILTAAYAKSAHKEMLDNRPWTSAIKGMFGGSEKDENVLGTHRQLKKTLMDACAITLQKAIAGVGTESEAGKMIDQSAAELMSEFTQHW